MSDKDNSTQENSEEKKKGGKKLIVLALVAVLLLGGAAGGFYFWRKSVSAESPEKAKGSKKSRSDEPKSESEDHGEKDSALKNSLPQDEDVKAIVELPAFIVNLADSEQARYLRMTVSLGIEGEEGAESEKPDQLFTTRVRNAMLAVLSEKRSEEILTVEGKAKLRKQLLEAAQAASEEPRVQAIYITDFIVQL